MTKRQPDENAKDRKWKTPMEMEGTSPSRYPERGQANPAGKAPAKSESARKTAHQHGRSG